MFSFVKDKVKKIYSAITGKMVGIFKREKPDAIFFKELNALLIEADTGVKVTSLITEELATLVKDRALINMSLLKEALFEILQRRIIPTNSDYLAPVIMLVGVNGTGKTTFVAKLAYQLKSEGKRVLLVAGDTFRAAATQQLAEWGIKADTAVFVGKEEQDPAAVVFDACAAFKRGEYDYLIIDTAGRLQTKVNLMNELAKVCKVVSKQLPTCKIATWLAVDAMLGQNSLRQAEVFSEAVKLDGIVLTKLDGTGKGGIVFAIADTLQLPIVYTTFGEDITAIKIFNSNEYIQGLLYE